MGEFDCYTIKQRIDTASYVGSDETSMVVNGTKFWTWKWQNNKLTYIACTVTEALKQLNNISP